MFRWKEGHLTRIIDLLALFHFVLFLTLFALPSGLSAIALLLCWLFGGLALMLNLVARAKAAWPNASETVRVEAIKLYMLPTAWPSAASFSAASTWSSSSASTPRGSRHRQEAADWDNIIWQYPFVRFTRTHCSTSKRLRVNFQI